jgi:hypothetical protein
MGDLFALQNEITIRISLRNTSAFFQSDRIKKHNYLIVILVKAKKVVGVAFHALT